MRATLCLLACGLAVGCGSDVGDDFTCAFGELTGVWRFSYVETDGTCGPISDETAVFDPGADLEDGCVEHYAEVSANLCRIEFDIECAVTQNGTIRQIGVWEHVAPEEIFGTITMTGDIPEDDFYCRSTYSVYVVKL